MNSSGLFVAKIKVPLSKKKKTCHKEALKTCSAHTMASFVL